MKFGCDSFDAIVGTCLFGWEKTKEMKMPIAGERGKDQWEEE